ncbi:ATP-binding protein [Megalodesulfovibrio paquesii]
MPARRTGQYRGHYRSLYRRLWRRMARRCCPRALHSWRKRLLWSMLLVALTPLALFVATQYSRTREGARDAALERLHAAATLTAGRVDALLRQGMDQARMLAALPGVAACFDIDTPRARSCLPAAERAALLDALAGEHAPFLLGHTLMPVADLPPGDTPPRRVLTGHRPLAVIVTPDDTRHRAEHTLLFLAPAFMDAGARQEAPAGVVAVEYSLNILQEIILRSAASPRLDGYAMLVDAQHQLLACGGHGLVEADTLQLYPAWRMEVLPGNGDSALLTALRQREHQPGLHAVRLRKHGLDAGFNAVFAMAPLEEAPWKTLFVEPETTLLGPVRRQLAWMGGAVLGGVLLAVLAGAALSRSIMLPIQRLTQAARRVAAGDLAAVAPARGGDEVGELGQAFNAMTERLIRRLEMELLVAQLSRRCLDCGLGEADASIESMLAMLGQFLAADKLFVLIRVQGGAEEQMLRTVCEWRVEDGLDHMPLAVAAVSEPASPGPPGPPDSLVPARRYAWLWNLLHGQKSVIVADLRAMPPEAAEVRDDLLARGLQSCMAVPVGSSSGLRGVLVAGSQWGRRSFLDEEATLLGMAAELMGNVLERNEALTALRASEARYALAQKAANIGSWEWDISSGRLFWSDAIAPLFGLQQQEFAGTYKAFLERVHPDDRKLVLDAVGASFRHGVGYNVEHRILHAGGGIRWVAEAGEVTRNAQGRPERMRGILQDITERKWAEEALARLNRRLEQLVEARTRDLGQKAMELEAANIRLLELDQMKTSFLTSVSHELRTPLTSILGFAKLVAKDFARHYQCLTGEDCRLAERGQRIQDNLDIISQEGERLTRLINDLLDLAKIESGKVQWRDEHIAPEALVQRAVRAVSAQFVQKPEVELVVRVAPDLPVLQVDADRMAQVLINLLHNAIKFTDAGEIRLEVRAPRPDVLQLRVEDTGQGIHLADLERIFDKFYQVAGRDTRIAKPEGTGLGLAICKQIVEHYHGAIWAESAWGQGSAFIVELPVHSPLV